MEHLARLDALVGVPRALGRLDDHLLDRRELTQVAPVEPAALRPSAAAHAALGGRAGNLLALDGRPADPAAKVAVGLLLRLVRLGSALTLGR